MLRLASDADVHGEIIRGLRRRLPEIDLVRAQAPRLLEDPEAFYSPKKRPSGHDIGTAFGNGGANGGAIPSNLPEISNTDTNSLYLRLCKLVGAEPHPARFPEKLPAFFINFLTEAEDLVLDLFAGSNTTAAAAEAADHRWLAFELNAEYLAASALRFRRDLPDSRVREHYRLLRNDPCCSLDIQRAQEPLPILA